MRLFTFVYDQATGALLFDADGSGAGAAQLFVYINGPFSWTRPTSSSSRL